MTTFQAVVDAPPGEGQLPARSQDDTELRYLVLAAQREGARYMAGLLKPLSLTPAQAEILLVLSQRAPLTLAEVGRLIVCESHSPSRIVDTLVKRGLVNRESGQIDRRVVYLGLSPLGEELLPQLREIDRGVDAMIASRLGSDEKGVMIRALRKIIDGSASGTALTVRFPRHS
ncbi:MarR family winged helix-turn-helix transcriptional regulator [Streptomyces sp. NBC_01190]|uniref:MarR family winged helix-turn-helix transcriptional regulator n=1 Tax=Streptomyces sp. NBC_01190 TaxID=2903767 RepID=UPI00386B223A|nr:MarR family transcriptional regulator [Streptomyces sp. NBC_01190]